MIIIIINMLIIIRARAGAPAASPPASGARPTRIPNSNNKNNNDNNGNENNGNNAY